MYTAGAYLAALPGGWIADRLIGAQRAVLAGGVAISLGNAMLASPRARVVFISAWSSIVLGVGLLKPNVSAIVADLYPEGGARLDAGFTVFYIGINVGGFLGPLVTGWALVHFGARAGFAAAAFFMAVGVVQFYFTRRHLGAAGACMIPSAARGRQWLYLWITVGIAALVLAAVSFGWIAVNAVAMAQGATYAIVDDGRAVFFILLHRRRAHPRGKRRGVVLVVLFLGSALFFSGYEQAGSSLNLFAQRYTDRAVGMFDFVIPAGWFQSLNSMFIFIFAPFFAWLWVALARRNLNPSAPAKFALGVMLMGSGFLVMAAASVIVASGAKVLPYWLIMTYLLHTFGELCLSPVGLSFYTKLTPKRFVGQMMGMWFLSLSLGNLVAGLIAGEFDANNVAAMPGQYMRIVYFTLGLGAVLLALSRPVKKLMGNVH